MSELYTASRLTAWGRCKRAEFYRYTLGIQTPSGPAATFGTHLHAVLEAWYRMWKAQDAQDWDGTDRRLEAAFDAISALPCDDTDRVKLRVLAAAYHARWGAEDWTVIAVEKEFRFWLGDVEIGGKIDAIICDADGRAFVVEHKSSTQDTSAGSPYWAKLAIDTQISIYLDAGTALDLTFAGCIYDVIKRPLHEPLKATPPDAVEYTAGRGCKACGGSGGGKDGIVQGRGYLEVVFASEVKRPECADCKGTGWKCDKDGSPQAPRPYAKTRLTDETIEEFEERMTTEIVGAPDAYLSRGVVVRLESELPRMRQDLLDTVRSMRALAAEGLHPPTFSSCAMGREMCGFFTACSSQQSIDDEHAFPRSCAHPELAATNHSA